MAGGRKRRRLRIERSVDATVLTLKNIPMVLRLGLIPALIALAISFAVIMAVPVEPLSQSGNRWGITKNVAALPGILLLPAGALVMVGIHRFIVLGERPDWVIARFGRHELAFGAAAGIVLGAFLALQFVARSVIDRAAAGPEHFLIRTIVGVPLVIAVLWLYLRLSLMPSHAAITGRMTPSVSWHAMAGNVWRGFVAWLAVGIGVGIAGGIGALPGILLTDVLVQFPIEDSRDLLLQQLSQMAAAAPAYGAMAAVYAAFLAYIYKDLTEELPPPPA